MKSSRYKVGMGNQGSGSSSQSSSLPTEPERKNSNENSGRLSLFGIPIPTRQRRHSDMSGTSTDSNSSLNHDNPASNNRRRRRSVDNSAISSPPRFRRPSFSLDSWKRSHRHSESGPIQIKASRVKNIPDVPISERYFLGLDEASESKSPHTSNFKSFKTTKRQRAISASEPVTSPSMDPSLLRENVPTVFKYLVDENVAPARVFIVGNMTNWICREMCRPVGENDFFIVIPCSTGDAIFKFNVDGEWKWNTGEETVRQYQNHWNVLNIKKSDLDVFHALNCDSFILKDHRSKNPNDEDRKKSDVWSQEKPQKNEFSSWINRDPPHLPPHLLQVLLNKEIHDFVCDPILLPEPSQVSVNHLYAQSIRDNSMVLSVTTRYKKKCVTVVLYKPID